MVNDIGLKLSRKEEPCLEKTGNIQITLTIFKKSFNLDSVDFYLLMNTSNQWLDFFNWVEFMSYHDLYNKCK